MRAKLKAKCKLTEKGVRLRCKSKRQLTGHFVGVSEISLLFIVSLHYLFFQIWFNDDETLSKCCQANVISTICVTHPYCELLSVSYLRHTTMSVWNITSNCATLGQGVTMGVGWTRVGLIIGEVGPVSLGGALLVSLWCSGIKLPTWQGRGVPVSLIDGWLHLRKCRVAHRQPGDDRVQTFWRAMSTLWLIPQCGKILQNWCHIPGKHSHSPTM